jgi:hypothetical protein
MLNQSDDWNWTPPPERPNAGLIRARKSDARPRKNSTACRAWEIVESAVIDAIVAENDGNFLRTTQTDPLPLPPFLDRIVSLV